MPGTAQVNFRVPLELKEAFYKKAEQDMGSATRAILKFMEFYVDDSFYSDDKEIGLLYMAVQSLHGFSNNMNQVARKLNSTDKLDPRFTPEFVEAFRTQTKAVTAAYKEVVTTKTVALKKHMSEPENLHA